MLKDKDKHKQSPKAQRVAGAAVHCLTCSFTPCQLTELTLVTVA